MINYQELIKWFLPYCCVLCRKSSDRAQDLCTNCLNDLPKIETACPRCARYSPNLECGVCLQNPPPFVRTLAVFQYKAPITRLIMQLKFNHKLVNARILGELLADKIAQQYEILPDLIMPLPLHAKRLRERGFNQALELALPIKKKLKLPLCHGERIKHTLPQATLQEAERAKNVRGAFKVNGHFKDKHIAVVDDVITTGYTVTEFCQVLKQAGAARIDVWCCARAQLL